MTPAEQEIIKLLRAIKSVAVWFCTLSLIGLAVGLIAAIASVR